MMIRSNGSRWTRGRVAADMAVSKPMGNSLALN
jgi:hypothetical protein